MADQLPTQNYYNNLGGVNQKASKYEMQTAQFLDMRNLDFDVPNALQKRPGSSLFSSQSLSGPVLGLYEFQKLLTGLSSAADFILANANGNLWQNTPSGSNPTTFSLISQNYGATQPIDFLTFANKAWMANGTKWEWFDGISLSPAGGLVRPQATFTPLGNRAASYILVAGMTMTTRPVSSASLIAVQVWAAYSEVRGDGYLGPCDFFSNPVGLVNAGAGSTSGNEWFADNQYISGFSVTPSATAIAIWVGYDRQVGASATIGNGGAQCPTDNGLAKPVIASISSFGGAGSVLLGPTLVASPDPTKFFLYTMIPTTSATFNFAGLTSWSNFMAQNPPGFSGIVGNFFSTFTPKYIEVNQNRMFFSGFSSSPSVTWWSEVGEPEVILPDSSFETRTNDGDRVYAIATFNNELLVMKENSFHRLIGDSADNFQLVQISDQYGCLSNKSVVKYDQKIYWLDKKGILEYYGANHSIVSDGIEGIFRRMNLSAAREYAVGVHHAYRNQLWWGIPVDGSSVNNLTVVYDYLVGGWTFFDGFNPASFGFIKGALPKYTAWRGDYTGFVHFFGESFFSDSGQGISCSALTRFEAAGENNSWLWRRFFLDNAPVSGGTLTGKVFSNYDTTTVKATFAMDQSAFQNRAEIGVNGKAVAVQFGHYSASLPLLINGYGLAKRPLRNV